MTLFFRQDKKQTKLTNIEMKNMKNSAVDLTDLALGIVVLGIVVSVGSIILIGVRDTSLTDSSVYATANETVTGSNTTAVSLDNAWFNGITSVVNATDGAAVGSGNYTTSINTATGQGQFLVVGSEFNGESLNVSYNSYNTTGNPAWTLGNDAALGLAEYGDWFDIIVIVGIAAVILALIFMAFGGRGASAGVGGSY